MSKFAVVIVTAPPPGLAHETSGPFVKIDGRETLLRTAELFLNRENIAQIQLVFANEQLEEGKRKYGPHLSFAGVKVLGGGARWIDQWSAAAPTILPDITHVIVHDAARPAIAYSDIDALIDAAEKHAVVALTTPVRASLIHLDEGNQPVALHTPSSHVQLVHPMVMTRQKFLDAAASKAEPHISEWHLLKGSPFNLRVGGAGDVGMIKTALTQLPKPKSKGPLTPFEEAQW